MKGILTQLLEAIETKNSWGKNELKTLILAILVEYVEEQDGDQSRILG